jgi:hypothetical protein
MRLFWAVLKDTVTLFMVRWSVSALRKPTFRLPCLFELEKHVSPKSMCFPGLSSHPQATVFMVRFSGKLSETAFLASL